MIKNKNWELESLRGIASISVLFWHFQLGFLPQLSGAFNEGTGLIGTPWFFLINGPAAVVTFFVLSGFVLTKKFYESADNEVLVNGAMKRYFRLLVPVFTITMISCILFKLNLYFFQPAGSLTGSPWLANFAYGGWTPNKPIEWSGALVRGTIAVFVRPNSQFFNSNLWTMYYEFVGSLLVFGMAPLLRHLKGVRQGIFLLLLLLISYFANALYLFCFVVGSSMALAVTRSNQWRIPRWAQGFLLVLALLLISYYKPLQWFSVLGSVDRLLGGENLRIALNTVGSNLLIFLLLSKRESKTPWLSGLKRFLGRISFPLYLVHVIVFCSFSSYAYVGWFGGVSDPVLRAGLTFAVTLVPLAAATGVFVWLDETWTAAVNRYFSRRNAASLVSKAEDSL